MKKKFLIIVSFLLLSQCGYSVINYNDLKQFNVESFNLEGENRLNRLIKKNIEYYSKDQSSNIFKINIKTLKKKDILEKNIKNEIVRYQVTINTNLEIYDLRTARLVKENFSEQGNFSVANKNIDTRNNEKKLIENLIENLSEKIIKSLRAI